MANSSKSAGGGASSASDAQTGTFPALDLGTIVGAQGAREEVAILLEKIGRVALAAMSHCKDEDAKVLFGVIHGLTDDDGCLSQIEGALMAAQRVVRHAA